MIILFFYIHYSHVNRDVTKFEFDFNECFKCFIDECEFVEKCLFYDWFQMHREQASANKLDFFLKFNLSHKLQLLNAQCNFCLVMCYTVLNWAPVLLTSGNNILFQSFNWPKRVHCIPSDKINASIRIHIQQILKVKIRIRMQILTSFITWLLYVIQAKQSSVIIWSSHRWTGTGSGISVIWTWLNQTESGTRYTPALDGYLLTFWGWKCHIHAVNVRRCKILLTQC